MFDSSNHLQRSNQTSHWSRISSNRLRSLVALIAVGAMISMLTGCGPSNPYTVVVVSGTLTLDGKPVPGVRMTFTPDEGRPSIATTDANGKFKPWYRGQQDGIQTGKIKVTIEQADSGDLMEKSARPSPALQTLLNRYGHGGKENLEIQVDGPNEDLKIELKSKA